MAGGIWHRRISWRAALVGRAGCQLWTHQDKGVCERHERIKIRCTDAMRQTLTVLNPLARIDQHIMDDSDLAGPILFFLLFGTFLLLVSSIRRYYMHISLTLYSPASSTSVTSTDWPLWAASRSTGSSRSCHHRFLQPRRQPSNKIRHPHTAVTSQRL